jgi:hypothetical protein
VDPLTIIVAALAAGASALGSGAVEGLTKAANDAVASAYQQLKDRILHYVTDAGVESVERKPESATKRTSLVEDLAGSAAESDEELLAAARGLVELLKANRPEAGSSIGVDLEDITAESLRIERIRAQGTGVQVKGARVEGRIEIADVEGGYSPQNPTPLR